MAEDPTANPPADPVDPPAGDPPTDPPAAPPAKGKAKDDPPAKINGADDPPTSDDWRVSIEDADLRKVADRFDSLSAMTKAVSDLRKRESTSIRVPGKDASEKDVAAYHKALGVPETVEGYEFAVPEGHEPTDGDKAFQAWAGETFHLNDISVEQAKGLNEAWNKYAASVLQAQIDADKKYADETETALKAEWPGKEFERNKAFADRAAAKVFGDALDDVRNIETKEGRFVLDHPAFVKMLAQVGREMDEGRLGGVLTEGDRDSIQSQIDDLQTKIDRATAQNDRTTAQDLYIKQQKLYEKVYGTAPVVGSEGRTA